MPNRSGQRRTTSRVLVPMDPVDPKSVRKVTLIRYSITFARFMTLDAKGAASSVNVNFDLVKPLDRLTSTPKGRRGGLLQGSL
jgi:hypothetical protein